MFKINQPKRLLQRFRRSLVVTIGSLTLVLALSLFAEIFIFTNLQNLDDQHVAIQHSNDTLLRDMLDQETGVRGYLNARGDSTFLEPYNSGRDEYVTQLQSLRAQLATSSDYNGASAALTQMDSRAEAWYNNFAVPQVQSIQRGDFTAAQDNTKNGKTLFDAYRASQDTLTQAISRDIKNVQNRVDIVNWILLGIIIVVALGAVVGATLLSNGFAGYLEIQLDKLMSVTSKLQQGDLSARVQDLPSDEIGELGQSFNKMADSLEQQQNALKERDILESVSQLNQVIMSNLDLEVLTNQFLSDLLYRLKMQMAAVYLFQSTERSLLLTAVQGLNREQLQTSFQLGESAVGQAAQNRRPYYVIDPEIGESSPDTDQSSERPRYKLKTLFGLALPAALYYMPLTRGHELLGVLVIGSIYPINENTRNVMQVITGNLSTAISNAQAFAHIQTQAEELERRQQALAQSNNELSHQRDELTVINGALEEASRVRNQFFSTMSHELRTPLTSIIGFAQILLRQSGNNTLNNLQKTNLDRILKNGQHLLSMVNTILDIAKIDSGRIDVTFRELNLRDFLAEIIDQTQSLATQKGLALKLEVEAGATKLNTDPDKLRQIVFNLVSNAIKFTDKGSVTIKAALLPVKVGLQHELGEDMVAISVKDTGIGIEPTAQRYIFDEFYQVDNTSTRKYSGTGLGLSITRKLTDLLGGKIDLQSALGEGSTFTVTLPLRPVRYPQSDMRLYQDEQATALPFTKIIPATTNAAVTYDGVSDFDLEEVTAEALHLNEGELLVIAVDDEPDVLQIIKTVLDDTPYHVVGVKESAQAVNIVSKLQPYAVTLDISMPQVNGWQVLQQLKSNPSTSTIPVIMVSVLSDRSAGYVLGASEYLTKPIQPPLLLATLERLAKKRTLQPVGATPAIDNDGSLSATDYILVVDDDADIRAVLQQILEDARFVVKTVPSGREALAALSQDQPRLILLDLMMPEMDGFEVLHQIKSNPLSVDIPVVILTAKTLNNEDYAVLRRGTEYVFQKGSLPMAELVAKLKDLLGQYNV